MEEDKYDNCSLDGKCLFYDTNHKYVIKGKEDLKITSVTTLIKKFHEKFNDKEKSIELSKKESSIYYGMKPKDILEKWKLKALKGSGEGTQLHAYAESIWNKQAVEIPKLIKARWVPQAIKDIQEKYGYELAKAELLVYSELLAIAGQSDMILKKKWLPEDENYSYAIYDWKFLGKPLERTSFFNGRIKQYKKMLKPFQHLLDCNWIHYSIQLAIYQTLTGDPVKIKEKVLVIVYDDKYEFVPCYPMRVFWDTKNKLQAVYETFNGKYYDSRVDSILKTWPNDIVGR